MFREAILVDDYAHHPDEIRATLEGAREKFGEKNIWTIFHPHTFTRTKALLQEFAQSFDNTDKAIIIDIYGSAREQQGGVSSDDLVNLINKYCPGKAEYIATIDEATKYCQEKSGQYDVLITMGAGDVWKVADKLKKSINTKLHYESCKNICQSKRFASGNI
jgi:UDP-N-acetylmuramate--alanine ligase